MNNRILNNVLEDMAALRQENEREENRRRAEIEQKAPEIAALLKKRHDMVLSSVRSVFANGTPADPEKLMAQYNRQIADQLVSQGFPADYLNPICRCALCQDTGYVYEKNRRKACQCLREACQKALLKEGEQLAGDKTFANFDLTRFPVQCFPSSDVTQREYMKLVRQRCFTFAQGVPEGPIKVLLLHGGSGLGKTYLLHCVGNAVRDRGLEPVYTTAFDLLNALKNSYFSRSDEESRPYFDTPLLLIDDLGMEPLIENITVEQIYNLVNYRLNRGLPVAVSTNLSRTELKHRYTERLESRLLDTRASMAIPFLGKDIRLMRD